MLIARGTGRLCVPHRLAVNDRAVSGADETSAQTDAVRRHKVDPGLSGIVPLEPKMRAGGRYVSRGSTDTRLRTSPEATGRSG
jgi:hypothetical protein